MIEKGRGSSYGKTDKTIGILTSGGDAPGMNAAIRAVVRTAINKAEGKRNPEGIQWIN